MTTSDERITEPLHRSETGNEFAMSFFGPVSPVR